MRFVTTIFASNRFCRHYSSSSTQQEQRSSSVQSQGSQVQRGFLQTGLLQSIPIISKNPISFREYLAYL